MTATALSHINSDGLCDTMSLADFIKEKAFFDALRKLKFFSKYYIWKPLGL